MTQISNGRTEREKTDCQYLKKVADIWSLSNKDPRTEKMELTEKQVWGFWLETQEKLQTSCYCSVS